MTAAPLRLLLVVIAAVALGPLCAAVAMWLLMLITTVADPSGWLPSLKDAIVSTPKLFSIFVIAAYRIGSGIALVAGLLIALWMAWRPPNLLVVLAASVAASLLWLAIKEPAVFLGSGPREDLLVMPPIAATAGAACWMLLRRYARPT